MRIPTKTRYGLRFMLDLVEHRDQGRIALKDVAERQGISKKYLEQVVAPLAAAGLLAVTRGHGGGYELARPAEEITVAEVVEASEGGLGLTDCLSGAFACEREGSCLSRQVWQGMEDAVRGYLEGISLADAASAS